MAGDYYFQAVGSLYNGLSSVGMAWSAGQVLSVWAPDIGGIVQHILISSYNSVDGTLVATVTDSSNPGYKTQAGVYVSLSGQTGSQGIQGIAGSDGAQGIAGSDGAQGIQGTAGAQGIDGAQGIQGIAGAQGITGADGAAPWIFVGPYDNGLSYNIGNAVTYDGGFYYRTGNALNPGYTPTPGAINASWTPVADRGTQGITGADGAQGIQGIAGSDGAQGIQGIAGSDGAQGTAGDSSAQFTYSTDLVVSLSNSKTFGRFLNGDIIPATGKTPAEVIQMAIAEALAPTVSLTSSTTIAFNQTAVSNVLNFSYTINSYEASVATAVLEWRRNNSGSWTTLTSVTSATTYTHTVTDTSYNTEPFNYRYTVVDTSSGTADATKNITPASYVAPSVSLTVAGTSLTSLESNSTRERGNVSSDISGSVSRNSANVALTSYQLQYQSNGGSWVDIGTAVSIGPGSTSITPIVHDESSIKTSSTIGYRVKVIDAYQTYISSQAYSGTSTVTFYYALFYGSSASAPTDSTAVRALPNKQFTTYSNPFTLNTGTTYTNFTVAMPATLSLSSVIDLDALNIDITSSYILSTFNVDDSGGTATSYKVYTLTTGVAYSPSHRHQITRA